MTDNKSNKGGLSSFFQDIGKGLDELVEIVEEKVVKPVGEAGLKAGQALRKELIIKDKEDKAKEFQSKIKALDDKLSSIDKKQASYNKLKSTANDQQLKFIDKKVAELDVKKSMLLKEKAGLLEEYKKISAELQSLKVPVADKQDAPATEIKVETKAPAVEDKSVTHHVDGIEDVGVQPIEPNTTDSH